MSRALTASLAALALAQTSASHPSPRETAGPLQCAPELKSAVAEAGLLSIAHFGAVADDGQPDDEAVRQAINASLQVNDVRLCACADSCQFHVAS